MVMALVAAYAAYVLCDGAWYMVIASGALLGTAINITVYLVVGAVTYERTFWGIARSMRAMGAWVPLAFSVACWGALIVLVLWMGSLKAPVQYNFYRTVSGVEIQCFTYDDSAWLQAGKGQCGEYGVDLTVLEATSLEARTITD